MSAISARLVRCSVVRSVRVLADRPHRVLDRCPRRRRGCVTRTLSSAFMAQATTWNGSRQITAAARVARTTAWIHSAPSQLTWVSSVARSAPSWSKNRPRVSWLRPSAGPHQPAGRVVNHARQVAVPLAVGDFVDADPRQSREQVVGVAAIGDHPGHDRRHGAPGDPQQHREHAQCGVRGQPRAGVLERPGVFGARPRPRHMRDHHAIFWAFHARHRGLQIRLCGPHIQGPPPPDPVPVPAPRVIPRTPLPTPRTTARLRRLGPHRQHQHLGGLRLLLSARSRSRSSCPRSPCSGHPDRSRIPWTCATP